MTKFVQVHLRNTTKSIQIKEYNNQRVITFQDIDALHERPQGTASRNFHHNKKHFIAEEDYFWLSPSEIQYTNIVNYNSPKGLTLLTESGYLMLVKSFQDDLAWEVQRTLVKSYFRSKRHEIDISQLSPELQIMDRMVKSLARQELETKRLSNELQQTNDKVNSISNIIQLNPKNWRTEVNRIINTISLSPNNQKSFKDIRLESYELLEHRAKCNLNRRLQNMQKNMAYEGAPKSKISKLNKMDVIESDNRLTEIYLAIVKELAIKYQVDMGEVI